MCKYFYLFLIQNAIITDLNLKISFISLLAKVFKFLNLYYIFFSLQFKICFLKNVILDINIFYNFFKSLLY